MHGYIFEPWLIIQLRYWYMQIWIKHVYYRLLRTLNRGNRKPLRKYQMWSPCGLVAHTSMKFSYVWWKFCMLFHFPYKNFKKWNVWFDFMYIEIFTCESRISHAVISYHIKEFPLWNAIFIFEIYVREGCMSAINHRCHINTLLVNSTEPEPSAYWSIFTTGAKF